ncbi:MAG: FAD-binding oxidoreductase [Dehalococcoidia bacterium]|nr:FAD-binding oxidoreductase [Dehalococcoidia bacterium]
MSISREAYEALQSIVGSEWVSDDPAICIADTKGGYATGIVDINAVPPACSIQPGSAEEVQQIVKVANRYKLPYVPTSTFFTGMCAPSVENVIMMDLKRMAKFEINDKDLYAIIEPGISFSMLQAELFRRGLFTFVPTCGAHASVLANHIHCGDAPLAWRMGLGYRRILATEWVLPDGEMLKLGSRAYLKDYFWGEGPGPDLRALLRGNEGHEGGLGTVTKIAVKIFPFIPEKLEPQGVSPRTTLKLPESRMKWYNIAFPTREKAVDFMYEMGRCEIALMVSTIPPLFRYVARSRGLGASTFWEKWTRFGETANKDAMDVRVLIFGWTSEKQLAYEERVLMDVIADFDGVARPAPPFDESNFMSADAVCSWFIGGRFLSEVYFESLDCGLHTERGIREISRKRTPPLADTWDTPMLWAGYEFAHLGKQEYLNYADESELDALRVHEQDCREMDLKIGAYAIMEDTRMFGKAWYNYNQKMQELKNIFDPNNLSNPPKPLERPLHEKKS